jgi:hypothetical protein
VTKARDGSRRRAVLIVLGLLVSAVATWVVIREVDLGRTAAIAATAQPLALAAALGIVAVQAVVRSQRWRLLLPRPSGSALPILRVLPVMLVGYLGNAVMPARLGEVLRAALIARREAVSSAEALGSALLERILDVLVLAALGVAAALLVAAPAWMVTAAGVGAGVALVGLAVAGGLGLAARRGTSFRRLSWPARLSFVGPVARQLAAGLRIADRPVTIAAATGLSLVAWLLDATVFWLVARSLGIDLGPVGAMLVSAVAVLSTAIPTAPGYVGAFELAAVAAAGASGITGEPALAFAVVAHLIAVVPLAVAGGISLWAVGTDTVRDLPIGRPAAADVARGTR